MTEDQAPSNAETFELKPNLGEHQVKDPSLGLKGLKAWSDSRQQLNTLINAAPEQNAAHTEETFTWKWDRYWDSRAPGTPVSRREHFASQHRAHLQAACQLAFAQGRLSALQLQPLLAILDTVEGAVKANGEQVYIDTLALLQTDDSRIELPGALLINVDSEPPVAQLLYVPHSSTALLHFKERSEVYAYLLANRQPLWPHIDSDQPVTLDYTSQPAWAQTLSQPWLDQLSAQRRLDPQRSDRTEVAEPPEFAIEPASKHFSAPPFGSLHADIPLGLRLASVDQQRQAIETLLGRDYTGDVQHPGLQSLKTQMDALSAAQQAASVAASALLDIEGTKSLIKLRHLPNADYAALLQAREDALRGEANIQYAMGQIDARQLSWVQAVLDTPDHAEREERAAVCAQVSLAYVHQQGDSQVTQVQELDGVMIITDSAALDDPTAGAPLLLYWPGHSGGLQAFESRDELEQLLFKRHPHDHDLRVNLVNLAHLNHTPLTYGLENQLHHCERQAAHILSLPNADQASELQRLREQTLQHLQVPVHAARDLAYAHILEQNRSQQLSAQTPGWLAKLTTVERLRLKDLINAYIPAMDASRRLLQRDLQTRAAFTRSSVQERLRNDFDLTHAATVIIDLPDSISFKKELIIGSGAPGTPERLVPVASHERSRISLEELALLNIDDGIKGRLRFMQVHISGVDQAQIDSLSEGIDLAYITKLVRELDVAEHYERHLRDAFMGAAQETDFSRAYRRECLIEPLRLMLKIQIEHARHKDPLELASYAIVDTAIDAQSPEAWRANGRNIVLLPANLSVGGADTDDRDVTLTGVTFIHEQNTGTTFLYLPDSPDNRCLRRFQSLEHARQGLFQLTLRSKMVAYLAGRALKGDYAAHISRINQASARKFDALISVGSAWPATTSLSAHLLNVHMGRLVEAHRQTSRANDALYLEQYALNSGMIFDYVKMALGVVPFVGTAIALYDAWDSANKAVEAFAQSEIGQGLDQLKSVLLSLIDAAMDLLPAGAANHASAVRSLTRQRQLKGLALHPAAISNSPVLPVGVPAERFPGYRYSGVLKLTGLIPAQHGIYRNIYRHAQGDFIISEGFAYQVELHDSPRTWRLSGNSLKSYKQPVTLDEAGQWNTHGAVYGTLINGGLAGGGGVLGHLADGLDPVWPLAIRERLPRWWRDAAYRRQRVLKDSSQSAYDKMEESYHTDTETKNQRYDDLEKLKAIDVACAMDITLAKAANSELADYGHYIRGKNLTDNKIFLESTVTVVIHRSINRIDHARRHIAILQRSTPRRPQMTQQQIEQFLAVRREIVDQLMLIETLEQQVRDWALKPTAAATLRMAQQLMKDNRALNHYVIKTNELHSLAYKAQPQDDVAWQYFKDSTHALQMRFHEALTSHHELRFVQVANEQQKQVLRSSLETYQAYLRKQKAWAKNHPDYFDAHFIGEMNASIEQLIALVNKDLREKIMVGPSRPAGPSHTLKRVFETEDNRFLIGVEHLATQTQPRRFDITDEHSGLTTTFVQGAEGKMRLQDSGQSSRPTNAHLPTLQAEANARLALANRRAKQIHRRVKPDDIPAELEDLIAELATQLETRAERIQRLNPQDPLIATLRGRAATLRVEGQNLRITQCLQHPQPSAGHLEYLLEQGRVNIRKLGGRRKLNHLYEGKADFLQEYEIRDLSANPEHAIWYAHFHYSAENSAFSSFAKAHLKLAAERLHGLEWEKSNQRKVWRGSIEQAFGAEHFKAL